MYIYVGFGTSRGFRHPLGSWNMSPMGKEGTTVIADLEQYFQRHLSFLKAKIFKPMSFLRLILLYCVWCIATKKSV